MSMKLLKILVIIALMMITNGIGFPSPSDDKKKDSVKDLDQCYEECGGSANEHEAMRNAELLCWSRRGGYGYLTLCQANCTTAIEPDKDQNFCWSGMCLAQHFFAFCLELGKGSIGGGEYCEELVETGKAKYRGHYCQPDS